MSPDFQSFSHSDIRGGGGAGYLAPVLCDGGLMVAAASELHFIVQRCVFRLNPPDKNSTDPCQTHYCSWSVFLMSATVTDLPTLQEVVEMTAMQSSRLSIHDCF